nr:RluA family pseudouridine synthase [uncultured Blautia sp.]
MDRILTYSITKDHSGTQILDFLRTKGFSRNILSSMKAQKDAILLNGLKAGGRTLLTDGDSLRIHIPEIGDPENIPPSSINLDILFEDQDILVVNKPAGMPVHPSMGNYENTLANGAAFYFLQQGSFCPFRCINRLDRDTSGALILAKNPFSAALLSSQMKKREIRRTYLAVVKGIPPLDGKISAPIARLGDSVIKRCVDYEKGEAAVTFYHRLASHKNMSLMELHLETGRTHQIRVHMGYLGFPLPADYLYCPDYTFFQRQPLHSLQLEFRHPVTGEELCFLAPVPEDMVRGFS